jgi:hypothetical protein
MRSSVRFFVLFSRTEKSHSEEQYDFVARRMCVGKRGKGERSAFPPPTLAATTLQRRSRHRKTVLAVLYFPPSAASRARTSGSSLMRMTVRRGCCVVGTE